MSESKLIGRRIAVYGPSGSGKSSAARTIGRRLNLPIVELDALFHRPNWEPTPVDEFRAMVRTTLDSHAGGWVCDGNYRTIRDIVLPQADTVVWLRLPFRVVYWRLLKRTLTRAWTKESLWGTNYESWRVTFLSRDSILLWGISHWRAHFKNTRRALAETQHHATVHELRSTEEVSFFLASLDGRANA